jgi:nitroreductase
MEFMDVIRNRRSIRKYKPDPVPEYEIKYLLEAARLAPSWANTQCWHFVVVTDPEVKGKIGEAGFRWSA